MTTEIESTEEKTTAELLDVVSAAIDVVDGKEPEAKVEDTADEPVKADAEKPEGEAAPEVKPDDTKKVDDKAAVAKPAEEKKPDAKPADAVNDPIPEDVKGRTRERMESLVGKVKETTEKLTHVEAQYNEIMGHISATNATPEQYGMVLDYIGAVNSNDETKVRGAIDLLERELKVLHERIGVVPKGVDPLEKFEDLRDAVEVGDITKAHATELAAARVRAEAQTKQQAAVQTQTDAQKAQTQAIAGGRDALNALEKELRAVDPAYDAKRAVLIEALKPVLSRIHPSQWAETFRDAYKTVQVAPAPKAPAPATVQPLRAKSPAGGTTKAAGSLEEAISMGIDSASRR